MFAQHKWIKVSPEIRACKAMMRQLMSRRYRRLAWIFYERLDAEVIGVDNYRERVQYPMDFGTIRHRLNSNFYSDAERFARDVRLVFHNAYAYAYATPEHPCFQMAFEMQMIFEKMYRNALPDNPLPRFEPPRAPLYDKSCQTEELAINFVEPVSSSNNPRENKFELQGISSIKNEESVLSDSPKLPNKPIKEEVILQTVSISNSESTNMQNQRVKRLRRTILKIEPDSDESGETKKKRKRKRAKRKTVPRKKYNARRTATTKNKKNMLIEPIESQVQPNQLPLRPFSKVFELEGKSTTEDESSSAAEDVPDKPVPSLTPSNTPCAQEFELQGVSSSESESSDTDDPPEKQVESVQVSSSKRESVKSNELGKLNNNLLSKKQDLMIANLNRMNKPLSDEEDVDLYARLQKCPTALLPNVFELIKMLENVSDLDIIDIRLFKTYTKRALLDYLSVNGV